MKSGAHRSSAERERETLLRCDILQMTRMTNDPTQVQEGRKVRAQNEEQEKRKWKKF